MEFNEAKEILKNFYLSNDFELSDEHKDKVYLKYHKIQFILTQNDIEEYVESNKFNSNLQNVPVDSSLCGLNYREQILNYSDPRPYALPFRLIDNKEYIFGNKETDKLFVTIGYASNNFLNYFRLNTEFFRFIFRGLSSQFRDRQGSDIRELSRKILTIKIFNMNKSTVDEAIKFSDQIFNACLFELAYINGFNFVLREDLPSNIVEDKSKRFEINTRRRVNEFHLPKIGYNSDVIKFYQLGMSSNITILQFLSYYQVLEYFFVKVSDEFLYQKISCLLNDPKFETTSTHNMDRLIQEIKQENYKRDEKEMLKNVMNKFIDEEELISFIKNYEAFLGHPYYTKPRNVFGEDYPGRIESGHVIGNIAILIKSIRNALVHSSDRYERYERHIPFSESTEIVKREIPLIKYLAEKVIISSASIYSIAK